MKKEPPRVFISYSHDSAEHKEWVLEFASTLRHRGIDAVLDQWDLSAGDDLPHFMETQLASCERVLMICTERYVEKANAGEGGVGYEKMIMTASLLDKIGSNKVIPVIRQKSGTKSTPSFMRTKIYIDFSNDEEVEYKLDELLRQLLGAPLYQKPPIGDAPFAALEDAKPNKTADGIRSVMEAFAKAYHDGGGGLMPRSFVATFSTLHILAFEKYCAEAEKEGLITVDVEGDLDLTEKGKGYLFTNQIVKD